MGKVLNKELLASGLLVCMAFFGCQNPTTSHSFVWVERNAMFSTETKPNPLMLVVGIGEDGKLSLNKIEIGTIDNAALLAEKLQVIFDDREKASITEREVVIDPQGNVNNKDLKKLIEALQGVKASPVLVLKGD